MGYGLLAAREIDEIGMRIRALTLIALMVVWMMPAGGSTCPSTARGRASHSHAHSNDSTADSHYHAVPTHADAAAEEAPTNTGSIPVGDGQTCCKQRGSDSIVLQPALQDAKPRTKVLTPLPLLIAVSLPAATWLSAEELRHQPPPPRPYACTRRPLLI
jgi:hypothetical protein